MVYIFRGCASYYLLALNALGYILTGSSFWLAILLIIGIILYQIYKSGPSCAFPKIALIEITLTSIAFHLIYQIPYFGLRGSDAYIDLASAKGLIESGFIQGAAEFINATSYSL